MLWRAGWNRDLEPPLPCHPPQTEAQEMGLGRINLEDVPTGSPRINLEIVGKATGWKDRLRRM